MQEIIRSNYPLVDDLAFKHCLDSLKTSWGPKRNQYKERCEVLLAKELNKKHCLILSHGTGALITADNAAYIYTGVQAQYKIGAINFTPSFTPGLYHEGDGKDLGHLIEFKSELQFSLDLSNNSELGFSYNHISNASLGDKNPGANSYMFNFLKNF